MRKFTESEKAFFVEYVPGHSYREIQKEFIKRFGWEITLSQIKGCVGRYKLNTGRNGRFEKGNVPVNKGQKMTPEVYEKCKGTMFKKGQAPINHRPVGSERISRDGYIEIKVAEPNKWKLKHRLVWEQEHGEVPAGNCLIFRDNDKLNTNLDNLLLITRAENLRLNSSKLSEMVNESKEVAVNLVKLTIKTNERKKRR